MKSISNNRFFLQKFHIKHFLINHKKTVFFIFSLFLIAFFVLLNFLSGKENQRNTYDNDTQLYFDNYANNLFKEEISSDALSAHFYLLDPESMDIDNIPQSLGTYSYDAMLESQQYLIEEIETLQSFEYEKLLSSQQMTYDILLEYFRDQLDFADLCLCSEILSPTTGLQAQLPILFSEYSFNCKADVENYLRLLNDVKNYFSQICDFQRVKAENDCFISDFCCDGIIAQCQSFINTDSITDNVLYTSFVEKISEADYLSDDEKNNYVAHNKELIEQSVIPAYSLLIDTLTELKSKGYCKNSNGLYYLENGKNYYEYLVKNYTGSSSSVLELKSGIQNNLMDDIRTMYSLLTVSPELEDQFYDNPQNSLAPEEILSDLNQKTKEDFPITSNMNYTVKYVDQSLQDYLSPAFYLSPPIDSDSNVIYINNGKNSDNQDLYTTLAHEGIPGHMFQYSFFASTNPLPIRQLINYGGYTEGWATYVEFMSYFYEHSNGQLAQALACSASYSLALYSLCDIGVNYEGWTLKDTKDFLSTYNLADENVCESIFQAVVEEPANYLQYYVGYMEICNLKERLQKELGEEFDLKKFHEAFLSIGPASFDVVNKWIMHAYSK